MRTDHNSSIRHVAQDFHLSPIARALRDEDMQFLGSEANEGLAYMFFMLMRWGSLTTQICPRCGVIASHRPRVAHKQWRCNSCRHDFSLKSGSLFEGTKLPYHILLKAMWLWSKTSKGVSAVEMSKSLGIGYEAAYLLLHKFRYAIFSRAQDFRFAGQVEMDVVWVFKHSRKFNCRAPGALRKFNMMRRRKFAVALMRARLGTSRKEAREAAAKEISLTQKHFGANPKMRPLLSIIERGPNGGIARSVGILLEDEKFEQIEPIVRRCVERGAKIFTDAAPAYSLLAANYDLTQVNHDNHYSRGGGKHTNYVESGFSRWRRMEKGTYHRMNARTIQWFFAECGWREEHRHTHPAERMLSFLACMMHSGVCRELRKYGTSQPDRELQSRRIELKAMALPTASGIDRLCATGLLTGEMVAESVVLRDDVQPPSALFKQWAPKPRLRSWDRRRKPAAPNSASVLPSTVPITWGLKAPCTVMYAHPS